MNLIKTIYCIFFVLLLSCSNFSNAEPSIDNTSNQSTTQVDIELADEICDDGEKRNCHVTLDNHNGVMSCFVGIQTCTDSEWTQCSDGEEVEKIPADDGKPLSLTEEKVCDDNPCDPRCSKWVEDGKWKADGTICKWTWEWSADPAGSIDKANKDGAAKEPCTHGSQCHQNQLCQDPAQGSCSHDICTKGDGLIKGCETDCVDKICELKPQCCEKKYEGTCETEPCLTYDKGLTKDCDPSVTKVCDWDKTCCPYTEWEVCSYWDIVEYQTVCEWVDTYVCGWNQYYQCGWKWIETYLCGWRWKETYNCGWRWKEVYICGWRWRYVYTYICGWYYVYTYICGWRWRYIYTYICGWRWKEVYLCGWRWRYVYTYLCGWRWIQTYVCGWRWTWIQTYVCGWTWSYNYYCDWWSCWWQVDYVYTCWWEQQYVYTYECWWEQQYVYDCWWENIYTYLYECWWETQYVYECWWEDVYTYLYECWWENVYTYGCWWEYVYTYLYECWWETQYVYECWWEQIYVYECWWETQYVYECWWEERYECWWEQIQNCWDEPVYGWIYYDCEKSYDGEWTQKCVDQYKEYAPGQCPLSWIGDWDVTCINAVHDTCHDYCDGVQKGAGGCVEWEAPNYDTKCSDFELGVGLTCKSGNTPVIPICNTGSKEAPKGIPIAIMSKGSGYFGTEPFSLPGATYCYTDEVIPSGECRNVKSCNIVSGDEVMINPKPNASYNSAECFKGDNWGFYYDAVCGYPPKCPGGYVDTVKSESYESTCDDGQTPQWGYLSWDATTPAGAEISFRIRTAKTKVDLTGASWVAVSIKSTDIKPDCSLAGPVPCPVDIYTLLGKMDAQEKFLEIETTFKVAADKKNTPTLEKWEISYTCIEEQ